MATETTSISRTDPYLADEARATVGALMNISAAQYQQIVSLVYPATDAGPSPAEAELIVAICQLAVAADDEEGEDETVLFDQVAALVYAHAKLQTSPPAFQPFTDPDQRLDLIKSHAAQLAGKPAAGLAYVLAYVLTIADLELAPAEGEFIDDLGEALGLDSDRADALITATTELLTPAE